MTLDEQLGERILRLRDVRQKTTLGTSTIYRRMALGTFPSQVAIGENSVGWKMSDVDAWILALPYAPRIGQQ